MPLSALQLVTTGSGFENIGAVRGRAGGSASRVVCDPDADPHLQPSTVRLARRTGSGGAKQCFAKPRLRPPAAFTTFALTNKPLSRTVPLLQDLGDDAGADGFAAFAHRKPQPMVHRDRLDQCHHHLDVVP